MDVLYKILFLTIFSYTTVYADNTNFLRDSIRMKSCYDSGLKLYSTGDYTQALDSFKHAFEAGSRIYQDNQFNLRSVYNALGVTYRNLGQLDNAIEYFLLTEKSYMEDTLLNELAIARLYNNIGNVYYNKYNYGTALEYYERAAEIFLSRKEINYSGVADIQYSIANIHYELGNYDKALGIISEYIPFAQTETNLYFLSLQAAVYQVLNKYEEAYKSFKKAIDYAKKLYSQNDLNVVFEYLNFASFLIANNNFDEAYEVLNDVKTFVDENNITHGITASLFYKTLGIYYENISMETRDIETFRIKKSQNLRRSINSYLEGLKALHFESTDSIRSNEDKSPVISLTHSLDILKSIADAYFLLYETASADSINEQKILIDKSLYYYKLTSDLIQRARKEIYSDNDKMQLSELEMSSFYKIIKTAYIAYEISGDMKAAEFAFENAERLKASSVFDNLIDQFAKSSSLIPDSLIELEKKLNYSITSYNEKLFDASFSDITELPEKQYLDSLIFQLKKQRDELNHYLEKNYPEYYTMKYSGATLKISDIQQLLKKEEVILEYVLNTSDENTELYSFCISNSYIKFFKLPVTNQFNQTVQSIYDFLSRPDFMFISNADSKKYCSEAYDLYQTLIYPFENDINNKKITVIADGILNYIPFDALLRELPDTTEQIQFNRLSYLTRKNIINYGYSANLLFNDYYRLKKNGKTKMLAFAPEYNNESITFQDDVYTLKKLQGTKREVELISRYVDSKIFIGSNATESNFRKNYKSYDILHLAMHAFINDSLPAFSCFAFSQNHNKEQENDGWLTIGDIYNLDMKARLTVLSACNTGSGKLKKGEGIISLARGFIYAGCPSIIMTLWEAEDNAGTKIMHSFYKNLKKGKATDVAMNLAKIEYLENANPHMAHPHYWIGYVSIGNHIPLFRSYDFYFFIILTFSFIGIMADQLIKMKKQKNQP